MPTPVWHGSTGLIFQKNSGTLTLADRSTGQDIYRGPGSAAAAGVLARGTFGSSARLGWVVTSCTSKRVESIGGDVWELTINWEAGGSSATLPLPCDEFDLAPQENYIRIERASLFSGITSATVALAYQAVEGPNYLSRNQAYDIVNSLSDATQKTLGLKLIGKLQNGEETFYYAYWRYTWVFYSYTLPSCGLNGTLTSPGGPLATPLSGVGSALQLADGLASAGVNGSCYKCTRSWLIAFSGHWDSDLY